MTYPTPTTPATPQVTNPSVNPGVQTALIQALPERRTRGNPSFQAAWPDRLAAARAAAPGAIRVGPFSSAQGDKVIAQALAKHHPDGAYEAFFQREGAAFPGAKNVFLYIQYLGLKVDQPAPVA